MQIHQLVRAEMQSAEQFQNSHNAHSLRRHATYEEKSIGRKGSSAQALEMQEGPYDSDECTAMDGHAHTPSAPQAFSDSPAHEGAEISGENKVHYKSKLKQRPRRPCLYCERLVLQISRHLKEVHKNEPEIKEAMKLSKEKRVKFMSTLRKKGMMEYNRNAAKSNSTNIQPERKGRGTDYVICSKCFSTISKQNARQHKCANKQDLKFLPTLYTNEQFDEKINSKFQKDSVGEFHKTNEYLQLLGRRLYKRTIRNKQKLK